MSKVFYLSDREAELIDVLFNEGFGATTIAIKLKIPEARIRRYYRDSGKTRSQKESMKLRKQNENFTYER